ncbi:MAG: ferritin-like domain-containing protein [Hydrogenophaga sp.]|nr:ferritin-like domain-containing protein [Hydrogenophaga sp.]
MPTPERPNPSLREQALEALCIAEPQVKAAATHALWRAWETLTEDTTRELALSPSTPVTPAEGVVLPGRPPKPLLVPPTDVAQRSPFNTEGLAALLHAVCHIEFNAINLALDAVWRFDGMPLEFYRDWLRVADEEATHFGLLREHLHSLNHEYGDFPAHNGLWEMCVKTQDDITARMALVPRTLEARGLDATPLIQARLRKVGTPAARGAVDILDVILRDEIGHVAIGNRWYGWLCERQQLDPVAHYRHLARVHSAPRLRAPFNESARLAAGFSRQELDYLLGA